jgi:DNA primase
MFEPSCIDVEDFLDCLEIRNVQKTTDTEIQFSCPFPAHIRGDQNPSASMNTETTAFICYSCHARGDAITFTASVLGVSPIVAIRMLKQRYSPRGIDPDSRSMVEEIHRILYKPKPEKRVNRVLPEEVLERYAIDWGSASRMGADCAWYMGERGFFPDALDRWQFGWSSRHYRITLPIRDEHGNLVGIKARAIDGRKPKYLNLRDEENDVEPYVKNNILFALDRVPNVDALIIVEGEFNAIAMHELGYRNTVAINGSYFGERQIRLIKQYADRVVIFLDSDPAGQDAARALAEALMPSLYVSVCPDHSGDPADMHHYAIRRCIEGAQGWMQRAMMVERPRISK